MLLPDDSVAAGVWDEFVRHHPDASFFHLSGWRQIAAAFGHRPHYLIVREGGAPAGVLPLAEIRSALFGHALVSTAFCVGGGPLALSPAARADLMNEADRLGRKLGVDYVELRDSGAPLDGWTPHKGLYAGFAGPIAPGEDDNLKQIPRKQRAVVRKGLSAGFVVTDDRDTRNFFPLYARNMRDHGTPALPRRFFDRLLALFGGQCSILTVHHGGRAVSSVLSYHFGGRVLPYYTGSLPMARALGANDHMYWALMRRAVARGDRIFDFGRSKVDTGPFHFKRNWGFEPRPIVNLFRLRPGAGLPNINPTNSRYAFFIRAWRRLPLPVANMVSPALSCSLA